MSDKQLKDGTANDGLGREKGRKLTKEEMARNDQFDLSPHFIKLYWKEPFYSTILSKCNRIKSRLLVPTAGVAVVNGRPTFIWNPDFVAPLKNEEIMGLLKHEAFHLIYNHVSETRRKEPNIVWNWAGDLSINGAIPRNELPEGGLIPGVPFKKPAADVWSKMTPEEQQRHTHLSTLIAAFPVGETADWYFAQLMADEEIKKMADKMEAAKKAGKDLAEAIGKALADALGGMDDHDGWGRNQDEEGNDLGPIGDGHRQFLEGEMKEALREAVQKADSRSDGWGSVPSSVRSHLRSLVSSEVDWRQILRRFVGMSRRANSRNSRKKVNRKVPYTFPGRTRNYTANIAIYVDQSGSVDDESLALLYAELRSLAKRTTFHFFPFDTSVDEENSFVWKKGQTMPHLDRFRCGGTDFKACVEHAHKNKDLFDGYLILSDGECSKPPPSRIRRGYIIVPNRKLFFTPEQSDVVIHMTGNKTKRE
jgi:predicted metal-dependent peptidase